MGNFTNYLEEKVMNHVFRNVAFTAPTTIYAGLVDNSGTDLELEAGTLTNEITAYTGDRKAVTFGAPSQVGGKATIKNTGTLEFKDMPVSTVKYVILCDSATKGMGNILAYLALSPAKQIANAGDTFLLPVDNVVQDLD